MPSTTRLALTANLILSAVTGVLAIIRPSTENLAQPVARHPLGALASAAIKNVNGVTLGTVQIEPYDVTKSRVTINVRGLPAGFHGFHIHSSGTCDPKSVDAATGSAFFSAGGHLDLGGSGSGMGSGMSTPGITAGNLPPLLVTADGTGSISFVTDRFRVAQLGDADGSSIIIHAKPDNFANIPTRYTHPADSTGTSGPDATTLKTGDAGPRIACGVIRFLA
ncbi:superoxide dismutase family protein [Planotetraspora sp. A-T 1434]|uniref:superoxide dismutase family protein n=1 Tax=Planotetraspora sp. A-T 1434 TaxID=2979219 RepID=UPI0021BE1729|nr:superoxide dismutase family protein [Planotetraspora sp. A-T 1434]MCT9933532.1 superoxide dismutase family protein [Planotetraspora sp. A-T 1434]